MACRRLSVGKTSKIDKNGRPYDRLNLVVVSGRDRGGEKKTVERLYVSKVGDSILGGVRVIDP